MAERVFCIDLGTANTKVALRQEPVGDSRLVNRPSPASVEDTDFCFPTVVAVDRRGARPVVLAGGQAAGLQPGGGVDVYRHWKKALFSDPPAAGRPQQFPLETMLESSEFRHLAESHGVTTGQITYLQQLVSAARSLVVGPGGPTMSAESRQHANAPRLAAHYLVWLRQQVLDACNRLPATGLRYETIPTRITVPAFALPSGGVQHPGCQVLLDAAQKAGWPVHPDRPFVSEPYSNAVGVLTKASNSLRRTTVDLGGMFARGPMITALRDPTHHPIYRALVIDVGAFTTDFAAVELNSGGDAGTNPDPAFRIRESSVAVGLSDLDAAVVDVLPKEKAEALQSLKAMDWHDLRRAVYSDGKGFRVRTGVVGGPSDDGRVNGALRGFAEQLTTEVEKFCGELPQNGLQELILTGGGSFIPTVRDALIQSAHAGGRSYVKIHAPALRRSTGGPPVVKLDESFTRGGSALGGASIYYEKDFY